MCVPDENNNGEEIMIIIEGTAEVYLDDVDKEHAEIQFPMSKWPYGEYAEAKLRLKFPDIAVIFKKMRHLPAGNEMHGCVTSAVFKIAMEKEIE